MVGGGDRVGPGTYVHIPAGVEHGITDVGPDGCTVVYSTSATRAPGRAAACRPPARRGDTMPTRRPSVPTTGSRL